MWRRFLIAFALTGGLWLLMLSAVPDAPRARESGAQALRAAGRRAPAPAASDFEPGSEFEAALEPLQSRRELWRSLSGAVAAPAPPPARATDRAAPSERVAIILVSYNMPERADALIDYVESSVAWPHDLIVVDNGSEERLRPRRAAVRLETNVQTTHGWLAGLAHADALAAARRQRYLAYWVLITSTAVPAGQGDVLAPLATHLLAHPNTAIAHPALTAASTTKWTHLKRAPGDDARSHRPVWMVDNIAALYRADWFDGAGRFEPALTMAWGVDVETSHAARLDGRDVVVVPSVLVEKETDVGYTMGRMGGMGQAERREVARAEVCAVYALKYGPGWPRALFGPAGGAAGEQLVRHWEGLCSG